MADPKSTSRRSRRTSDETVRGEYSSGTGWEAGQRAPSTKYIDGDGKVVDDEPKGGGHVLVFEGDTVREHMVAALNPKADDSADES